MTPPDHGEPPCPHAHIVQGPDLPRRYGVAPTDLCADCGAWRPAWNRILGWRPAITLAEALQHDEGH